jgi:hypothetical protein
MKRSIIISLGLIVSSLIFSADNIYALSQSKNTIELTSGKVRLGEVYSEKLIISYVVKNSESKQSMMNAQGGAGNIYQIAFDDFQETLETVNKAREKEKKEPLSIDSANWTEDMTITMITEVTYQSQYQPSFKLTIDESIINYDAKSSEKKSVIAHLSDLKPYAKKMYIQYKKSNSFIN